MRVFLLWFRARGRGEGAGRGGVARQRAWRTFSSDISPPSMAWNGYRATATCTTTKSTSIPPSTASPIKVFQMMASSLQRVLTWPTTSTTTTTWTTTTAKARPALSSVANAWARPTGASHRNFGRLQLNSGQHQQQQQQQQQRQQKWKNKQRTREALTRANRFAIDESMIWFFFWNATGPTKWRSGAGFLFFF